LHQKANLGQTITESIDMLGRRRSQEAVDRNGQRSFLLPLRSTARSDRKNIKHVR
jgi:hypothetical protein